MSRPAYVVGLTLDQGVKRCVRSVVSVLQFKSLSGVARQWKACRVEFSAKVLAHIPLRPDECAAWSSSSSPCTPWKWFYWLIMVQKENIELEQRMLLCLLCVLHWNMIGLSLRWGQLQQVTSWRIGNGPSNRFRECHCCYATTNLTVECRVCQLCQNCQTSGIPIVPWIVLPFSHSRLDCCSCSGRSTQSQTVSSVGLSDRAMLTWKG